MIVGDLNVDGFAIVPSEADAPLVVDPDTVLPFPVSTKLLKSVRRWNTKIVQVFRTMEDDKFPIPNQLNVPRKALRKLLPPDLGRLLVLERIDHMK
jgi:hypothetical protein